MVHFAARDARPPVGAAESRLRITIRRARALPPSLARLARRRFEFALGRFGARVESLTIRLLDLNGPKGGIDKQCLVAVRLNRPRCLIVIEDTNADAATAIDRAAGRAARAVARAAQTLRNWRSITPGS